MAIQGKLNSELSKATGLLGATFIVHTIATSLLAIAVLAIGLDRQRLSEVASVRWFTLLGAPLSIAIIYAVASSFRLTNLAAATTAIVLVQISTAALLDHLGILGSPAVEFTPLKAFAILLISVGARILLSR